MYEICDFVVKIKQCGLYNMVKQMITNIERERHMINVSELNNVFGVITDYRKDLEA
jgi:hypothetical protein